MAPLPGGLLRPTTQPESDEPTEAADDTGAESRGGTSSPSIKPRRKRVVANTPTKGRKLHLSDDIHDRLWLLARSRKTNVSAVACDILDKALPRWRVEREG
jgi:hypothetical protein